MSTRSSEKPPVHRNINWWSWSWDTEADGDQNEFNSIHENKIFTRGRWDYWAGIFQRNRIFLHWSVGRGIANTCQKLTFYSGDLRSITLEAKFDGEVPKKITQVPYRTFVCHCALISILQLLIIDHDLQTPTCCRITNVLQRTFKCNGWQDTRRIEF